MDLHHLCEEEAEFRIVIVTDDETFETLKRPWYRRFSGVAVVNLLFGAEFRVAVAK